MTAVVSFFPCVFDRYEPMGSGGFDMGGLSPGVSSRQIVTGNRGKPHGGVGWGAGGEMGGGERALGWQLTEYLWLGRFVLPTLIDDW